MGKPVFYAEPYNDGADRKPVAVADPNVLGVSTVQKIKRYATITVLAERFLFYWLPRLAGMYVIFHFVKRFWNY